MPPAASTLYRLHAVSGLSWRSLDINGHVHSVTTLLVLYIVYVLSCNKVMITNSSFGIVEHVFIHTFGRFCLYKQIKGCTNYIVSPEKSVQQKNFLKIYFILGLWLMLSFLIAFLCHLCCTMSVYKATVKLKTSNPLDEGLERYFNIFHLLFVIFIKHLWLFRCEMVCPVTNFTCILRKQERK